MRKPVVWTLDEKQKLREEYTRLRTTTSYSQEACLTTAMLVLSEHRRKNVKDATSKVLRQIGVEAERTRKAPRKVAKKLPGVPEFIENQKQKEKAAPAVAPLPLQGGIGIATENFIAEIAKEVAGIIGLQVLHDVRTNVDAALYGMFDKMVKNVSEAVLKEVSNAVRNSMPAPQVQPEQHITFQTTAPLDADTSLAVAPRNRKPKVAIIGLMSQQQQEIRKEFSEVCDLVFTQSSNSNIAAQIDGCDMAFIMVKFSNHSAQIDCRRRGVPFYLVTGAVTHLRVEMRKWINGEVAIAEVANG